MSATPVERDERTTAIENAGYRRSYLVLSFGLLALVAARSFLRGQQSWDLLALVVLGGAVNAGYQAWHRVLYKRWVIMTAVTMIVAAILAVLMVASPVAGQSTTDATAARDPLLNCAERMAVGAGFRAVAGARPGRLGMMRTRATPGASLLDGLRVAVASPDTARSTSPIPATSLDVRVTTFIVSPATGLSQQEMTPPRALTALADSIRSSCRR